MNSRLLKLVERLRVRPNERILEIGCGHGVAADLICRQLTRGMLVAIDRSPKMIAAAKRRNAPHIAAGRAEFHVAELEEFDPRGKKFDAVFAIRVALFHREPQRAEEIVRRWLKPRGRILAEYDEP